MKYVLLAVPVALAVGVGVVAVCCPGDAPPPAPPPAAKTVAAPATEAEPAPVQTESLTVEGMPWLKKVPGVKYAKPRKVPDILYKKYTTFDETQKIVQAGGGEFVQDGKDPAYQLNWIDPNSHLSKGLGLRPGDKIISVNGQPVGKGLRAGKAMFEDLKNEKTFSVLVERDGKRVVLTFNTR